jgi:hypothetical protein
MTKPKPNDLLITKLGSPVAREGFVHVEAETEDGTVLLRIRTTIAKKLREELAKLDLKVG